RAVEILLDAQTLLVEPAEAELRRCETLPGRAFEPLRRGTEILRHPAAFGQAHRNLELGRRIALDGGCAKSGSAHRGPQLVGRGRGHGWGCRGGRRPRRAGACEARWG